MTSPLRFLFLVSGPSAAAIPVGAAVVAYAAYIEWLAPDTYGQVLAIVLFLQLFAASTGYRRQLRSGHFDPLLVGTLNRWRIAAAHWTVSISAGAIVWLALAAIELIGRRGRLPTALMPAVIVLFLYVSTVVWSLSVVVGRLSGAVIWLAALFVLNATGKFAALRVAFIADPSTVGDLIRSAAATAVVPPFLMLDPTAVNAAMLALVSAATAIAWLIGAAMIWASEAALVQS